MIYRGYVVSHGGRVRTNNEDNAYLQGYYRRDVEIFEWEQECKEKDSILAAVFDGMGGERDGEVASKMAAEAMAAHSGGRFSKSVANYTVDANEKIALYDSIGNMGTTYVILSVERNWYHFYNLGDSRGYLYRKGRLKQISLDHTLIRKMLADGRITKEEAATHPARHVISQYLGMKEEGEVIRPEYYHPWFIPAMRGDICLLCSDGLTDMLPDQEIEQILKEEPGLRAKGQRLLEEALAAGGRDNVTVLLVEAVKRRYTSSPY